MVQKSGQIWFRGRKTISSHNSINCDNQAKLETQVAFLTGVGDSDAVWNRLNRRKIVSRHHGTSWQCRWGDIEEIRKRIGNFVEKEQVSPDRSVFQYSPIHHASWISCTGPPFWPTESPQIDLSYAPCTAITTNGDALPRSVLIDILTPKPPKAWFRKIILGCMHALILTLV